MKVICISGKAQHGKDTTATMLKEMLEKNGKNVIIAHFADLLKYICKTYFGWDGQKDERGRHILQYVGTDVIRAKSPNYWADFIVNFFSMFQDEWDYVILPDCHATHCGVSCSKKQGSITVISFPKPSLE